MQGDEPGGPIRWRMHLNARPETVYAALDSDDGRSGFWAESAVESDGYVEFRFINGMTHRGRIVRRDPPSLWVVEYFGGEARFELAADGRGGTDLLLHYAPVPEGAWQEMHAGWLNVLFPLKALVDHRIDLRNHDPERSWDHGYADQ